ncbi:MAG: 23S rRNA (cytosine1962-C5)-methyltransferase [Chlamydiales bacterium]|jgi:23S rRNA (cytosine1962-C5)-methyltransferase
MDKTPLTLPDICNGEDKSSALGNRIKKNYRHVRKWAKRSLTDCFRLYDRELPHYPLAIDFYNGRFCVHYFSNDREKQEPPKELLEETTSVLCAIFGADPSSIFWRNRIKRRKTEQYEKASISKDFFIAQEYGVQFKVNLIDYLDTGLFLDHRETRKYIASIAKDKRLLNLFAYTCSFSIHAAVAGASFTKSVDMSNTYTAWGKDNLILNKLSLKNNEIVRADCLTFLDKEIQSGSKYDIIVIDPPTISRSKKMDQMFDIQIDYISLISKSLRLLEKKGVIFFSTNSRKFIFDKTQFPKCQVMDVSNKTLPIDFHDPRIHSCWRITQ